MVNTVKLSDQLKNLRSRLQIDQHRMINRLAKNISGELATFNYMPTVSGKKFTDEKVEITVNAKPTDDGDKQKADEFLRSLANPNKLLEVLAK